jgi:hypothetical protein
MTKPIATVSIDGSLNFLRSTGKDAARCTCCEGPHIFSREVVLDHGVSVAKFVRDFATIMRDGKPVFEGRRVRLTVEIIEP